jgi:broad specificity phosphatase PhoE
MTRPGNAKSITLIRHGQSEEQSGESGDGMNPKLSQVGVQQALQLKKRLAGKRFDLALISPLDRAYETYRIVEPRVGHAAFDSRLIEVDFVANWYSGMAGYVPAKHLTVRNALSWLVPVEDRAQDLMGELLALPHERILLFGHQGIFKQLIGAWLGVSGTPFMYGLILGNTSLTGLTVASDGTRSVHYLNDLHHIEEHERGMEPGVTVQLEQRRPWRADCVIPAMAVRG